MAGDLCDIYIKTANRIFDLLAVMLCTYITTKSTIFQVL